MKPMWTVAVSATAMTLAVAVMAMVRLSLLIWMVWAGRVDAVTTNAKATKRRIFIRLLLWSLAGRPGWPCVWAWRRVFVWGRGGRTRAAGCRRGLGRWILRL